MNTYSNYKAEKLHAQYCSAHMNPQVLITVDRSSIHVLPAFKELKTFYTFHPFQFTSYSKLKYTPEQETAFSNLQCRQSRSHKYFRALETGSTLIRKGTDPSHHLSHACARNRGNTWMEAIHLLPEKVNRYYGPNRQN